MSDATRQAVITAYRHSDFLALIAALDAHEADVARRAVAAFLDRFDNELQFLGADVGLPRAYRERVMKLARRLEAEG